MTQLNRYLRLAADAKTRIREISVSELKRAPLPAGTLLIDVREGDEFRAGHIPGAIHLSRGVIEGRIEELAPALDTPIVCYCAAGNRSALVADNLQRMGYTDVRSVAEGFKGWIENPGTVQTAATWDPMREHNSDKHIP
ncbi:MAG: sulfurtransferase [Opitutaceae bacterium]|nr:sulfurtransferase [Opitutaceae bacterium]